MKNNHYDQSVLFKIFKVCLLILVFLPQSTLMLFKVKLGLFRSPLYPYTTTNSHVTQTAMTGPRLMLYPLLKDTDKSYPNSFSKFFSEFGAESSFAKSESEGR